MDANVCYKSAVLSGKKEITIGMRVDEETRRTLEKIVDVEDRKIGYIARELMLRGLALYQQDGRLRDTQPIGVRTATVTLKPARKTLAPVVARIEPGRQTKADVRRMLDEEAEAEIQRRLRPKKRKKA